MVLVVLTPLMYVYMQTLADSEIVPNEGITVNEESLRLIEKETVHGYDESSKENEPAMIEDVLPEEKISVQHTEYNESNEVVHGYSDDEAVED